MKLKICGLKYADNIKQVAALDPDYLGFVFYEPSKRFVGTDFIMPPISPQIKRTGVFVNAPLAYIEDKVKKYGLDYAQLQGDETPEFCAEVKQFTQVIRAFGLDDRFELRELDAYKSTCNYFLFDTKAEIYEGVGKPLQLSLLEKYDNSIPYFIGGGMDMDKFRLLSKMSIKPYGIDVINKAEIKPGYKDIIRVIQLRNNVH